ncbi:hypothetical protein TVAG_043950 [Trichomonas vaginalis G3]|uniref:Uncharacterized protein n=1 Tax=Trichomonas vaginalis (strain ATCC PRA-98 / G3) TaxID=412133 RepID=A2E0F5_TRIV3|nr:hypothetical protein TVAGG3_0541010 [Trichomonas vaginalis G3]EAY13835.1 hypothetical protein TVAG_043950 [Trichomonas vaginalis G3]KAI5519840.1 hypothetical protein TVAGG3_0541010 [Trichomonas vaginalis G3]|eukprot:XP_001326058.1 hypothetical protein [Trichomonas vaginalis G3]
MSFYDYNKSINAPPPQPQQFVISSQSTPIQPSYMPLQPYQMNHDQAILQRIQELEAENKDLAEKCAAQKLRIQILEQKMFDFYTKYQQLPNVQNTMN